jgi:hypothetical protein
MRTPHRTYGYALFLVITGCAAPEPPKVAAPPPRDLAGERRLAAVTVERDETEAKLLAVDTRDRERCEFQVGDCKILVHDQRDELMSSEQLSECRVMTDEAGITRCMADELVKRRKQGSLATLYDSDVACMHTVLACTDQLRRNAQDAAVQVRAGQREKDLRHSKRGAAATSAIAALDEKVHYLRATLPPAQSSACAADDARDRCDKTAGDYEDQLEAELEKDDFRADAALGVLEREAKAREQCSAPEIACLSTTLEAHGLYPEGKKWVQRNFEALERREQTGMVVAPAVRSRCITQASKQHQGQIVNAYVAYVHDPVLFFRVQLDKAFLAMHESQVACLSAHLPRSNSGQAALSP